MSRTEELLEGILVELQKFNNRMENLQSMVHDWQDQDEHYHKRNEKKLDKIGGKGATK